MAVASAALPAELNELTKVGDGYGFIVKTKRKRVGCMLLGANASLNLISNSLRVV